MTPSVSTLGSDRLQLRRFEPPRRAMERWVVGDAVDPAAVDDADPGTSQDTHGVWVIGTPLDGGLIDTFAAQGLAWRLLSANVAMALRKRVLQAQRKPTARCLPERRVTGAMPDRAATASGPS